MEDFSIRAIVIGVSLFVTMLTLTAILLYFNTARQAADVVNERKDIGFSYDEIIESDVYEAYLTGVETISLINKYAESDYVQINIVKIGDEAVNEYNNINNTWLITINEDDNNERKIISVEKLDIIDPVWTNYVEKIEDGGKVILNLSLGV